MASTELSAAVIVTETGTLTATVLDRVSVDRLYLMMLRGSMAAIYGRAVDSTSVLSRDIKDLVVFPFTEE